MTTYPHAGIQHSETLRENPRLTPHYTPADLRFERFVREMAHAHDNDAALLAEANDTLFRLWNFIRSVQKCPTTSTSSSSASPPCASAPTTTRSPSTPPREPSSLDVCEDSSNPFWMHHVMSH